MPGNTVYLVTGASRGIGKQIVAALLLRSSTTVIATARTVSEDTLPTASTSSLITLELDDAVKNINYATLQSRLQKLGIAHIDVVIANAATCPEYAGVLDTNPDAVAECFGVNSIGPLKLFQQTWPLLERSDGSSPNGKKFILISSSTGSIGVLDMESFPTVAYGMSKAAANWFAKSLSVDFRDRGLRVGIIHPGWVQTSMGQGLADTVGVAEPPTTAQESAEQILKRIDELHFDTTHGKFISYDGQPLPW